MWIIQFQVGLEAARESSASGLAATDDAQDIAPAEVMAAKEHSCPTPCEPLRQP